MTSKVEELREKWLDGLKYEFSGMLQGMSGDLDSLLAKVHAEGVAEGRKEGITKGIARNAYEMGKHDGMAAGAELMKEIIRKAVIEELHDPDYDTDIIPASVLAPKPERGKPSQALLDELSEICGEKVEYEPKAQP